MDSMRPYDEPSTSLARSGQQGSLLDVLDRVLDKGVVIAGDIRINLLDIELLTIKIRLLIASADKAREMGIDWWSGDPFLTTQAKEKPPLEQKGNGEVNHRLERIEAQLQAVTRSLKPRGEAATRSSKPKTGRGRRARRK